MSDTVALTGIIIAGLVIGVVAIVGIIFGIPVRSKVTREGFELSAEPPRAPADPLPPATGNSRTPDMP
jgi:hypothetical protein